MLIRTDNTTVVSYINHQAGLHFYILEQKNVGTDILSRQGLRPGEWPQHSQVVESIWQRYCQKEVDLFASKESTHCPLWFALTPPAALGLDAMLQMWPRPFLHYLCSQEF